jgi:hypothetical protein
MSNDVCVFTSVCDEDAEHFGRYLREMGRLAMPFAVHLDRCVSKDSEVFARHPLCVGTTRPANHNVEFNETHKQQVFDLVVSRGFKWALALDVDETFEKGARPKIDEIVASDHSLIVTRWVNLWLDERHARIDGPFVAGRRMKFYNLARHQYRFLKPEVNGAYVVDERGRRAAVDIPCTESDLVCLHYGLMTPESCRLHKERWDRIYKRCSGANPYGIWKYACDPDVVPEVIEHDYI